MRPKPLTLLLFAIAAVTVGGCKRSATGQVVAVVNGEEISLSELNAELKNAAPGGDKQVLRAAALQSVITRKLLVQQARERGIDKDPDFLQRQRRANDELLVAMLGQQVTKNVPVPSTTEIDRYIAAHPEMFAQRSVISLDQIIFEQPQDMRKLKALEADHNLADVANTLTGMSISFGRQKATLDTMATPPALLKQINALPPGEPFVMATGGRVVVSVLGDKQVQPVAGDAARRVASEAIRRAAVSEIAQRQVKQAQDAAKIEYQPGFSPAGAATKPGAKT